MQQVAQSTSSPRLSSAYSPDSLSTSRNPSANTPRSENAAPNSYKIKSYSYARGKNRPTSSELNYTSAKNDELSSEASRLRERLSKNTYRSSDSSIRRNDKESTSMEIDVSKCIESSNNIQTTSCLSVNLLQAANMLASSTAQKNSNIQPTFNNGSISALIQPGKLNTNITGFGNLSAMPSPINMSFFQPNEFLFQQPNQFQQQLQLPLDSLPKSLITDDLYDTTDYRGLLIMGQITHQIVQKIFQTPITPLDLDPSSPFLSTNPTQSLNLRLQELSAKYNEAPERMYHEISQRNATLGLPASIWEKLARREYVNIAQFHPEQLLTQTSESFTELPINVPGLRGLKVKVVPGSDGNFRVSIVDDQNGPALVSPGAGLAVGVQSLGLDSAMTSTSALPSQQEIRSFACWSKAWTRYVTANTILFSLDYLQLKKYHDIICGFAEQYNWADVQRFDNARRTVHAADHRDLLVNDIPTIRKQCLTPESRLSDNQTDDNEAIGNPNLFSPSNVKASRLSSSLGNTNTSSFNSLQVPQQQNSNNLRSPNSYSTSSQRPQTPNRDKLRGPGNSTRQIPQSGSINNIQICGEFNGRRGCSRKQCSYLHICATCSGTDHGRSLCSRNPLKTSPYPPPISNNRKNLELSTDGRSSSEQNSPLIQNNWRIM
ncbi:hypothetical protein HK096_007040, partial [Nowakowskiella sp. JEL0078]